jgi:methyl-accepting chemotaxis protein
MQRFISNLRFTHKFILIGAVTLLMALVPATIAVRGELHDLRAARNEASGIAPAGEVLQLLQLSQQHRGMSAGFLGGNEGMRAPREAKRAEVDAAWQRTLATLQALGAVTISEQAQAMHSEWRVLADAVGSRALEGPQSFARHTELITRQLDLLEDVADASGMTLDPVAETYFMIQATLSYLPQLTESLGQARAQGALVLARGEATPEQRARLSALSHLSRMHMRNARKDMDKAVANDAPLQAALQAPAAAAWQGADAAFALLDQQVLQAESLTYPSADYFAAMTRHIDVQFALIDRVFTALADELRARESAAARNLWGMAALLALLGALCVWVMAAVARSATRSIGEAVRVAQAVAGGDLTSVIHPGARDETGDLLQALKTMNDSLVRIVSQVRQGSENIVTGSSQIATGNADLSQRTEEQASNLEQTAASMEQLTATVQQNADTAQQASTLAHGASSAAVAGGEVVGQVVHTMQDIAASSRRISDIIGVIDGIAFQTNILALNAAVEAARAGEQGRGFAVVAGEVRNLAQRSAEAAKEIKGLINASVERVDAGTELVEQAGQSVSNIVSQVQRVNDLIGAITAASAEQSSGISQVGHAVAQLDQVTQQNAALVEESAAAADSLKHQATVLADVVNVFRLRATA